MKYLAALAGSAIVVLGVAACSNPTGGQPTAGATTDGRAPTSTRSTPDSNSPSGSGSLPADQPCSLLSSTDLSQLGVSSPVSTDAIGTAYACELDTSADHIIIAVRTNVGLNQFQASGGTVQDMTIGSHQAKQVVDNTGSCVVAIGVSDSSRVDVTVTGDGTTNPCPTAESVAHLVAQRLP